MQGKFFAAAVCAASACAMALAPPARAGEDGPAARASIVNGSDAAGPIPQLVLLELRQSNGEEGLCGGTMITRVFVATAAHCVTDARGNVLDPTEYTAVPGAYKRSEITDEQRIPVSEVTVHAEYDAGRIAFDVAVIKLSREVDVAPARLPAYSESAQWDPGVRARIAGWGLLADGGDAPDTLQEAAVTLRSEAFCERRIGGDYSYESMLCAGGAGEPDTCQGDSGGPLFAGPDGLLLAGITSFGMGCGENPGVYARTGDPIVGDFLRAEAGLPAAQLPIEDGGVRRRGSKLRVTLTANYDINLTIGIKVRARGRTSRIKSRNFDFEKGESYFDARIPKAILRRMRGTTSTVTLEVIDGISNVILQELRARVR